MSSVKELENALNEDLLRIVVWLNNNKLTPNLEKTKSMLTGSDRKLRDTPAIPVSVSDHDVKGVDNFNYLGATLSSNFTWADHVDYASSKTNQRLGLLRRIKTESTRKSSNIYLSWTKIKYQNNLNPIALFSTLNKR